jgi:hypothetical protein
MFDKPLYMPEAKTFADVLEYHGEWNHSWPRHPETNATIAPVEPRYIPETTPAGTAWERSAWRSDGRNEIGPFATVQPRGEKRRSIAVRATDATIAAMTPVIVTPDDHLSFEIIEHADGRALVLASHGYIIGSIWLAYIDPATIPPYPFAARDKRRHELYTALEEAGRKPMVRDLPDHTCEILTRDGSGLRAIVDADGSSRERWMDGSETRTTV